MIRQQRQLLLLKQFLLLKLMMAVMMLTPMLSFTSATVDNTTTSSTSTDTYNNDESTTTYIQSECDFSMSSTTTTTTIPQMSSPFLSYPNVLCITEEERRMFHPIIFFPMQCWKQQKKIKGKMVTRNNNNNKHDKKYTFTCPATDFTSSDPHRTAQVRTTTTTTSSSSMKKKRQLLSLEEFQIAQQNRKLQRVENNSRSSSSYSILQKKIRILLQDIHHIVRYPFRYIIPSIQYYFDHSYLYQYFLQRLYCSCCGWVLFRYFHNNTANESNCDITSSTLTTTTTRTYIGRYDEDRMGLYTSDLFRSSKSYDSSDTAAKCYNDNNANTTTCLYRSIHVGMDVSTGRVGTPIYAFTNGIIYSFGYNPELGDYGNVIIIQHYWYRARKLNNNNSNNNHDNNTTTTTTTSNNTSTHLEKVIVYALYGHLSDRSIMYKQVNDTIQKGQMIGYIGNIYENGGWYIPHLHFQLSTIPPPPEQNQHDMPGAICYHDRNTLLHQYIDPRYVLGNLH